MMTFVLAAAVLVGALCAATALDGVTTEAPFRPTRSQRRPRSLCHNHCALFWPDGAWVHAVPTGPVDTDMSRGLDIPKASPESVARAIFDGVEKGDADIFPDPVSESTAESWLSGAAKALERRYAALVEAEPVKS